MIEQAAAAPKVRSTPRITLGFGICVLLIILCLFERQGLFLYFLLAAAVHEGAHIFAIYMLGGSAAEFKLGLLGGVIYLSDSTLFSYGQDVLIALSGSIGGLFAAFISSTVWRITGIDDFAVFAGASAVIAIFNFLPAIPLDGGIVMHKALCAFMLPDRADMICRCFSFCVALVLTVLGGYVFLICGANPTLMIAGVYLICSSLRAQGIY